MLELADIDKLISYIELMIEEYPQVIYPKLDKELIKLKLIRNKVAGEVNEP